MTLLAPSSPSSLSLDEELAAVFDAPESPPNPTKSDAVKEVPPSPPPLPKRTIVTALLERRGEITGHASKLAEEIAVLKGDVAATNRVPISQAMMQRRRSKHAPSVREKERLERNRSKKARDAFKAVGSKAVGNQKKTFSFIDRKFVNMSIVHGVLDQDTVSALFEHCNRVDIADIKAKEEEIRASKLGEFVIFGCLVRKHSKKESKTGSKYAVWSLCNMPRGALPSGDNPTPTIVTLLLCDEAYHSFHTQIEGAVFALRKPNLLPPRSAGGELKSERGHAKFSGHCLRVTKKQQLIFLGVCNDYRLCKAGGRNLTTCGVWYDANRMRQCPKHALAKRKRMTMGSRMDVNNAERPGMPHDIAKRHIEAPVHISLPVSAYQGKLENDEGYNVLKQEEERRKRKKEGAVIARLNRKRLKPNLSREDAISNRMKLAARAAKKRPLQPMSATRPGESVVQVKSNPETTGCTKAEECQAAIRVLVKHGYTTRNDGVLVPPLLEPEESSAKTSAPESTVLKVHVQETCSTAPASNKMHMNKTQKQKEISVTNLESIKVAVENPDDENVMELSDESSDEEIDMSCTAS